MFITKYSPTTENGFYSSENSYLSLTALVSKTWYVKVIIKNVLKKL